MNDILINPATNQEYENVPTEVAAKFLDSSPHLVREGLKQGILPIGTAIQCEGGKWKFIIPVNRLKAYSNGFDTTVIGLLATQLNLV